MSNDNPKDTHWTRERLIASFQRWFRRSNGKSRTWRGNRDIYEATILVFGSWEAAMAEAGLPEITPIPCQKWSKQAILEALRDRHRKGIPLSCDKRDDKLLRDAAVRWFGGWNKALRAAGLPHRICDRWTPDRVLHELRRRYRGETRFRDAEPALAAIASHYFGGLYAALEAAGLDIPRKRWTRQRIIDAIQERYVRGAPIDRVGFGDDVFLNNVKRYFASWSEALNAAGLADRAPHKTPKRSWTDEAVLAGIRKFSHVGTVLSNVYRLDHGLYVAATRRFGTWNNAVQAAGLRPAQRKWSRKRVLQCIRDRHHRRLSLNSRAPDQDAQLVNAAYRLFGGWQAALSAAGLMTTPSDCATRHSKRTKEKGPHVA
ncbi:MAG: hypothetical protein U0795_20105 [Pirellulales bacterium]